METSATTHDEPSARARLAAPATETARERARERQSVLSKHLAVADTLAALTTGAMLAAVVDAGLVDGLLLALACSLTWTSIAFAFGLYADRNLRSWVSGVSEIPHALVAAVFFSWPLMGFATVADAHPAGAVAIYGALLTVTLSCVGRATVRARLHRAAPLRQRAAVVGSGVVAGQLVSKLENNEQFGILPVGLVDDDVHHVGSPDLPVLGTLDQLDRIIAEQGIDRVIIAFSRTGHEELLQCIRLCRDRGVVVDIVPRLFEFLDGAGAVDQIGGLPVISIGVPKLSRASAIAKRGLDVLVSGLLLVLFFPVFALIALAIRVESRGPVFFHQPRVGRGRRTFRMLKFRSMYRDADRRKADYAIHNEATDGVMFKIRTDPRVTRVGRVLRRLSLDELPQLINVFKGDMSLVGPRPLIKPETEALAEGWHERRLDLRPGMTGPWQVQGRSDTPFQEMVRLDYQYVSGWSLARDVEILFATVPAVLSGRGAY